MIVPGRRYAGKATNGIEFSGIALEKWSGTLWIFDIKMPHDDDEGRGVTVFAREEDVREEDA